MKDRILSAARALGALALARRLTGGSLRILGYHGLWIGEGRPYGNTLFMPVDLFARRMRWLARSGYPVLDLPEAAERLEQGTLPKGATVITIDDGWRSIHSHMLPILEELGLPSTLYAATYYVERQTVVTNIAIACAVDRTTLITADLSDMLPALVGPLTFDSPAARRASLHALNGAVDALPSAGERAAAAFAIGDRLAVPLEPFGDQFTYMSPEELADAQLRGMRVELHTHRHRGLSGGVDFLGAEIEDNRTSLARSCRGPFDHFCYPGGEYHAGADAILRDKGIATATTTLRGLNPPGTDPLHLRRFLDSFAISQVEFETYMAGGFEPIDRRRRLVPT
ncbi:polysaccharide deacetylase family protein [Sphingomonas sp. SRS2]|uniref:polysaccharide deacetylase family protein n=1 Tax=Sphingomonas sp. SRS2 TaxID=133190 RepID=UPI000618452B|nr:polysaccharide deacetylase family protein [Sphingomonas sp. SRS2]KKC24748.1 hypothetical protein WP12_17705 [Sphingomonas sp. SRS2]